MGKRSTSSWRGTTSTALSRGPELHDARTQVIVARRDDAGGRSRIREMAPSTTRPFRTNSSASPMVGPDGDVYYGVLGNPSNGSRGWMLHFSGNLRRRRRPVPSAGTSRLRGPGSDGAIVHGNSTYLIFSKYNNYAGPRRWRRREQGRRARPERHDGRAHASSNGQFVMKEILTIAGRRPTPTSPSSRKPCANGASTRRQSTRPPVGDGEQRGRQAVPLEPGDEHPCRRSRSPPGWARRTRPR